MRTCLWLLGALMVHGAALAEPGWLAFERLDAALAGDQVDVRYEVASASWAEVAQDGERPELVAEVLGAERRSRVVTQDLRQASGQFKVVLPEGMVAEKVRFAVRHPRWRGFLQGGVGVVTVSRGLGETARAPAPAALAERPARQVGNDPCGAWGEQADECREVARRNTLVGNGLVVACADQGRNRMDCLRNSISKSGDMTGAVRACSSLVAGVDERQRCVAAAARARQDAGGLVRACGQGFETPTARLACMERAVAGRSHPTGLVEQCVFAFEGPVSRLDCVALGEAAQIDLAPGVAACRQALAWATPRRKCVEAAAKAQVDVSTAIIACRSGARSPAAVLECVQVAARGTDSTMVTTIHDCSGAADDVRFNQCVAQSIQR